MQPEVIADGLDPLDARPVARAYAEKALVPAQIVGPVRAHDPVDRSVGRLAVTRLVPGLKAECRDAEFRSGQRLRCAQQVHARSIEPDAGALLVWRRLQHRDLANARTAHCESERAAGLPTANDGYIVVDTRAVRHPVGRIGTNQTKRRASIGVWVR